MNLISVNFDSDKSKIVRAFAIIFMIILHNDMLSEFKICVPMYSFLVGYGYAFSDKTFAHTLKRIWNLLSHFWLILLGVFLPTAILSGIYTPKIYSMLLEMFGIESNLNWYSWYVYFYIFAMLIMIPISRVIIKFGIKGILLMILLSIVMCCIIHCIEGWNKKLWLQVLFDCFLNIPVVYSGFYISNNRIIDKIRIPNNCISFLTVLILAIAIFTIRSIPYATFFDFLLVPVFVVAIVIIFNFIQSGIVHRFFISVGKESMNMWFIHALFTSTYTATIFAPLLNWIQFKSLYIAAMIIVSYYIARMTTAIYNILK